VSLRGALLAGGLLLACTSEPPDCPKTVRSVEVLPAAGKGAAQSGALVPDAEGQELVISADHRTLEYRFRRGGVAYTARYALARPAGP
jgi:hypothetical protein